MRNKRPDLNGILAVNKPIGWTSNDVCRYVRKITGGAKVGHAGTLDPLASGVLLICLGNATKSIESLMDAGKEYEAAIDLAHRSPTDDLEAVPEPVVVTQPPTLEEVRSACARFVGLIDQAPPAHSAVWIDGERAYARARRGESATPAPRPVKIDALEVLEYSWPLLRIRVRCGRGTYIRSLARDIGAALAVGGVLTGLVRTRVGKLTLALARATSELERGLADLTEPPTVHGASPNNSATAAGPA